MSDSSSKKYTSNLWKQAYETLKTEDKGRERLHKLNTKLKQELGKPDLKLRSDDGYRELLSMIQKKARKLESKKSTEKVGTVCSNMMKVESIVAAGANVGGPYIAIPAAALFCAFAMNEIYMTERAAMFEVADTIADFVVANRKAQDWTTVQANDDFDMRDLKESLQSVFISLYKAIIFASAQLMLSLDGDFQWLKNVAKHYDWAGQLETLNKRQNRVTLFMHSKEWQEAIKPPKNRAPIQRDAKRLMGPGPRNPLHWAAALGVPDRVTFLVQKNEYPINALTNQSWTAAHLAAREGHSKILKTLMTVAGIDLFVKNREERTPLHIAAIFNRERAAKVLLERSPGLLGPRDKWQRTAFTLAAEKGHIEILKVLKQFGQDMNETTLSKGWTALHLAAENGHVETVQWLLENGTKKWTKVKDGPQKGLTAKQVAELKGRAQVVEIL